MLDAFIIEELRRREEAARRREAERPRLELPLDPEADAHNDPEINRDKSSGKNQGSGVVVIELSGV